MSAGDWKDLYAATLAGDHARVCYHLDEGVNPNYQHPEVMCTPLVASLMQGHAEITRTLLAHGADPCLRSDFDGLTPLQAAQRYGRDEFVALLQQQGVKEKRQPFWWRWLPV